MPATTTKSAYWRGVRDGAPFVIVVIPFSTLFGVAATEAGMNLTEVMAMTALVIAGAAQFTALALMQDHAPTVIVIASALAVNLRMVMYSAALAPHLGGLPLGRRMLHAYFLFDQPYALAVAAYVDHPRWSIWAKSAYFFGTATPIAPLWYIGTWLGAVAGTAIPAEFALDFAVPVTFIALIGPALRTGAHVVAALVSVSVALALGFLPYNLGLFAAALAAMAAGAEVERRREARA